MLDVSQQSNVEILKLRAKQVVPHLIEYNLKIHTSMCTFFLSSCAIANSAALRRLMILNVAGSHEICNVVLQEESMIQKSVELDKKLKSLIHETEIHENPSSTKMAAIKHSLDSLMTRAHASKGQLLDHYRVEHESWKVAPKENTLGQLDSKPVR